MLHTGTMRIKENQESGDQVQIKLTVDFSGATPQQMAEWAYANRKIAFANMLRENWSQSTIDQMVENGHTVLATDASKKMVSKEQMLAQVQALIDAGLIKKDDLLA